MVAKTRGWKDGKKQRLEQEKHEIEVSHDRLHPEVTQQVKEKEICFHVLFLLESFRDSTSFQRKSI